MAYRNGQRLPLDESGAGAGPVLRLSVNPRARRLSVRIDARAGELNKTVRANLCAHVKRLAIPISGTLGFEKAEVTAGGVR